MISSHPAGNDSFILNMCSALGSGSRIEQYTVHFGGSLFEESESEILV